MLVELLEWKASNKVAPRITEPTHLVYNVLPREGEEVRVGDKLYEVVIVRHNLNMSLISIFARQI